MHRCLWNASGHDLDELLRQVTRRVVIFEQEPVPKGTSRIGVVERDRDARAQDGAQLGCISRIHNQLTIQNGTEHESIDRQEGDIDSSISQRRR